MDKPRDEEPDTPLNPALKSTTETVYDTKTSTPAPFDSASAKEGEGEGWPVIWLVIVAVCIILTIYFFI